MVFTYLLGILGVKNLVYPNFGACLALVSRTQCPSSIAWGGRGLPACVVGLFELAWGSSGINFRNLSWCNLNVLTGTFAIELMQRGRQFQRLLAVRENDVLLGIRPGL